MTRLDALRRLLDDPGVLTVNAEDASFLLRIFDEADGLLHELWKLPMFPESGEWQALGRRLKAYIERMS